MRPRDFTTMAVLSVCLHLATVASSGAFTYQGRLHEKGDPAQGNYDLSFTLYQTPIKGSPVSETIRLTDVPVDRGYFSVELDFEPAIYNGEPRWLNITAKRSRSIETPQTLAPRQKISPVPYAIHSTVAERLAPPALVSSHIIRVRIEAQPDRYFLYGAPVFRQISVRTVTTEEDPIIRKLPGQPDVGPVVLRTFATQDRYFDEWFAAFASGQNIRKTIRLAILDAAGYIVDQWDLYDTVPNTLRYDHQPQLNAVTRTVSLNVDRVLSVPVPAQQQPDPWQPGPQPLIKGPFELRFDGGSVAADSFTDLGTELVLIPAPAPNPFGLYTCKIKYLEPTFSWTRQQDAFLNTWYNSVIEGGDWRKAAAMRLNTAAGDPILLCTISECWPCAMTTTFDPAANDIVQAITLAVNEMELTPP